MLQGNFRSAGKIEAKTYKFQILGGRICCKEIVPVKGLDMVGGLSAGHYAYILTMNYFEGCTWWHFCGLSVHFLATLHIP